jgi:hypothetical protein
MIETLGIPRSKKPIAAAKASTRALLVTTMAPPARAHRPLGKGNYFQTETLPDIQIERHKATLSDSEDVLNAALDAETEALDMLVWTPPATVAGILALLAMGPALRQARIDDDRTDAIMISAIDALRDIHPSA